MAGIHFPITGDNANFINALNGCKQEVNKTTKAIESSGADIESIFSKMKKSALAFGAAIGAEEIGRKVLQVRGDFQQLEVAFTTMLGSAEKANSLITQLAQTAAVTPFGLQDVASGAKQLIAYGLASEKVNDTLIRLGDIAAGLSIPLGDLVYLYGTTMTQGRMYTMDLRQFMGRGIPMVDELAKVLGVAKDEVDDMVTAGKVGFAEMEKAIVSMTSKGGKFAGLMEEQSKTITGQISNIEDAIDSMFNEIGKSSEGVINLALSGVSALVENYEKVGEALMAAITMYGTYKAALILHIALRKREILILRQAVLEKKLAALEETQLSKAEAIGAAKTKLRALAQQGLVKAIKATNAAMLSNPYIVIAAGVTALAVATYKYVTYKTEEEKAIEKVNEAYQRSQEEIGKELSKLARLKGELEGATEGTKDYETAKKTLIEDFSKYDSNLSSEIEKVGLTAEAYEKLTKKINESISARMLSSTYSDIDQDYSTKLSDNLNKLYNKLINELGDEQGAKLYAKIRDKIFSESLTLPDRGYDIGGLDDATKKLLKSTGEEWYGNSRTAEKYIMDIIEAQNIRDKMYAEAKNKFKVEPLKEGGGGKEEVEEKKNKKYWEEEKKKAQEDLDALTEIELKTSTAVKLRKKIAEAESKIALYTAGKKAENEEEKRADAKQKASEKLLDLMRNNQDKEIQLEKETRERRIREIELTYQKEIDAISKYENELKELNDKSGGGKTLTQEQSKQIQNAKQLAEAQKQLSLKVFEDENLASSLSYLRQYGDYQQKKFAITSEYTKKINEAQTEGDKLIFTEEMKHELQELDKSFGKATTAMADLFEDSSKKSVNAIQDIIDKYELFIQFMSGMEGVSKESILAAGFTEDDIKAVERGEISIKDVTDAVKNLKGKIAQRSPFKTFAKDVKEGIDKIKNAKGDFGEIGEGLSEIGNAGVGFAPALKQFSSDISTIFGYDDKKIQAGIGAVEGLGQTAAGIGQAMSGDILGGIMSAASGISQVVKSVEGMFGADHSDFLRLEEQYNNLVDIWDTIIAKKKEYISIDYGSEAQKAGREALELLEREEEATRNLGLEWLKRGASAGSHSYAYRMKRDMSSAGWNDLASYLKTNQITVTDVGSFEWLFNMTSEQLADLMAKAPDFWASLKGDAREYLETIISCGEESDEIRKSMNEALVGVDFDSFYSDFVSLIGDMDADSEDFADKFGEYLRKSILNNMIAESYKGQLEDLYNQYVSMADSDKDGKADLTAEEISSLTSAYRELVAKAQEEAKSWDVIAGTGSYSQEASAKGFQGMSQETADELNGRFTALQVAGESIKAQMLTAVSQIGGMLNIASDSNSLLAQIRDSFIMSNTYLEDIAGYSKIVSVNILKLNEIADNTNRL